MFAAFVTLACRGGWRRSQDVGPASSPSIGLRADVGVASGSFLLVVVAVELVLHQEDEDEDEHRGHDDPPDDDDHGAPQELKHKHKVSRPGPCRSCSVH